MESYDMDYDTFKRGMDKYYRIKFGEIFLGCFNEII